MNSIQRTAFASLQVIRLGRNEWRISDAADNDRLLGYIEHQGAGRFEVLWMSDPMRWGYAKSFDEALVAFGDSARFTGEVFLERAAESGSKPRTAASSSHDAIARRSTWLRPDDDPSAA